MMVDIHQHVIYGVDDGPGDDAGMRRMLRLAAEQGVAHLVATPHATPGREPFPTEVYLSRVAEAQAWCAAQGLPLKVHTGCELLYTDDTPRLLHEGYLPTLAETWMVLVEFFPADTIERMCHALRCLGNEGFTVVMAHVERYRALQSMRNVAMLRNEYQVKMQMNCNTILSRKGFFKDRWTHRMLEAGYIDCVASDAHNTSSRPCAMRACMNALTDRYGREMAKRLCGDNQRQWLMLN